MLNEIGAEPPLRARRALVRRVFLDPRRSYVDDLLVANLKVDLAPDTAVGTDAAHVSVDGGQVLRTHSIDHLPVRRAHRHRDDVVNGSGRADAHALAAPRATGVLGIPIGADDDFCVVTPGLHIEDPEHLDILARANAARAEDARAHVVLDDRVVVALVAGTKRHAGPASRR